MRSKISDVLPSVQSSGLNLFMARNKSNPSDSSAHLGFEATARRGSANPKGEAIPRSLEGNLWLSADKLRNNMDEAEPSGARQTAESSPQGERGSAKQYLAANVFWVPVDARWPQLQSRAKLPTIGKDVDDAMVALERDNPRLKGALNKNYGRADLDKHRLGELIDLIGSISFQPSPHPSPSPTGRGLR